jgi:hypothetical protein
MYASPLSDLLSRLRRGKCRDVRDRVFALLSLVEERLCITISYEVGIVQLFRHALETCMHGRPIGELLL